MQAFTRSVFDLFSSKKKYLVPMFQRPYVWGLERQWEPLWEDIRAKAQEHLDGQEVDPHFLGAIVINQLRTFGPAIPAHEIIDGQQRLTTFQLFLAAFRDVAREFNDNDVTAELISYTLNTGKKATPEEEFKIWPTRTDQQPFSQAMKARSRKQLEELHPPVEIRRQLQPRHKMVEAYLFFERAIRAFLEEGISEDRIQALFSALQNSLQLVSIELETKDDPQIIFETLNARGEPLLSSDLLRNFVFLRAKRENLCADDLYDRYWQSFDTEPSEDGNQAKRFWKIQERQGRLLRPRLDLFIQHFLSLKTGKDVNVSRLFHDYRHWIESETPYSNVEEELKELQRYARVFARLFIADHATALGRFISRLRRLLDTNTVFPLLLYLEADSGLSDADRAQILIDLESYLVRRIVCGLTEKAYNRLFLQLIRNMREAGGLSSEVFRSLLLALEGESTYWPDDHKFREAWLQQPVYRTARSSARVETMLRAIEEAQVSDRREKIQILGSLTIEHVMPQEWEANWPLPVGGEMKETASERELLIHTFGNLTLLTSKLNTAVSNGPYSEKRSAIIMQSALCLNAYFQGLPRWEEHDIRIRGENLLGYALRIWPFPANCQSLPVATETSSNQAPIAVVSTHSPNPDGLGGLLFKYWTAFVQFLSEAGSELQPNKPYAQNWIYFYLNPGGFRLEATVVSNKSPRLSCGLTIKRPDAKDILAHLKERREWIEQLLGASLDWDSRNERSSVESHVQTHWQGADMANRDSWNQQFEWMRNKLENLRDTLLPIISQLPQTKNNHPVTGQ